MSLRLAILLLLALQCFRVSAFESITLMWDACTDTNVAGYMIYDGPVGSGTTNATVIDASTTTVTLSNLTAGVTYFFFVTAYDAQFLESDPSNVIFDTPLASETNRVQVYTYYCRFGFTNPVPMIVWQTNVLTVTNWCQRTNTSIVIVNVTNTCTRTNWITITNTGPVTNPPPIIVPTNPPTSGAFCLMVATATTNQSTMKLKWTGDITNAGSYIADWVMNGTNISKLVIGTNGTLVEGLRPVPTPFRVTELTLALQRGRSSLWLTNTPGSGKTTQKTTP